MVIALRYKEDVKRQNNSSKLDIGFSSLMNRSKLLQRRSCLAIGWLPPVLISLAAAPTLRFAICWMLSLSQDSSAQDP